MYEQVNGALFDNIAYLNNLLVPRELGRHGGRH